MQDKCDTLLPHLGGNYGRLTKRTDALHLGYRGPDWHADHRPRVRVTEYGSPLSQLVHATGGMSARLGDTQIA
jgi:hypothetical protein